MLIGQQQQQQMNKMSDCVLLAANGLFTTTLSLASLSPVVAKRRDFFCTEESQFSVDAGVNGGERDVDIHTLKRKSYHPSTAVDH